METQTHQFGSPENSSIQGEHKITKPTGLKRIGAYVLYGVPVLLLLILLMVNEIRFSQLNKGITDVKLHLERISNGTMSPSILDATTVPDVHTQAPVLVEGRCRDGWLSFQSSCYLLSTTSATWHKAEEQCRLYGAHLVVVNNVEEMHYILGVTEIIYSYWIGLVELDGHWTWVDGTDFNLTPTFWDDHQPDNFVDYRNGDQEEDCAQLYKYGRKPHMWHDALCYVNDNYICEIMKESRPF